MTAKKKLIAILILITYGCKTTNHLPKGLIYIKLCVDTTNNNFRKKNDNTFVPISNNIKKITQ